MQETSVQAKLPPPKYRLGTLIFGHLWAIWGLLVFVSTLFPEPSGVKTFKAISKGWMTVFLYSIGCSIKIINKHYYNSTKNYVVTCNHSSLMDVPLLTPFFPGPNKTIAKKSFTRVPLFGWVYARGSVLVDRSSDKSRKKSYEAMKRVLQQENLNMVLYPEGTRNRTGQPLKSFYDGAFRLAADCGKDIIPVIMFNTAKALPPGMPFFLLPNRLEMHLLPPVIAAGKTAGDLKEAVYKQMWEYVVANKR